jgi:ParB-like chromosome segregation protein Spo0J
MSVSQIEEVSMRTLRVHPSNARTHSRKQVTQSIRHLGFTVPILIDEAGTILAGTCAMVGS